MHPSPEPSLLHNLRRARVVSTTPGGWGSQANAAKDMRYTEPLRFRRFCRHDHQRRWVRATHAGMANGVALARGCEWHMQQWVRERADG